MFVKNWEGKRKREKERKGKVVENIATLMKKENYAVGPRLFLSLCSNERKIVSDLWESTC